MLNLRHYFLLLLLLLWLGASARAATILRTGQSGRMIAISYDDSGRWRVGDRVCIERAAGEAVCGRVVKLGAKGAIAKLEGDVTGIAPGDTVVAAPGTRRPGAKPTLLLNSVELAGTGSSEAAESGAASPGSSTTTAPLSTGPFLNDISGGLSVGLGFFFPLVHFQHAFTPQFALGFLPLYFHTTSGVDTVSALGALVTANYYADQYFRGLWVQVGTGLYSFSSTVTNVQESGTSVVFLGTAGWRGEVSDAINFGVAGGLQFISNPGMPSVQLQAASIQPVIILDLGFNF